MGKPHGFGSSARARAVAFAKQLGAEVPRLNERQVQEVQELLADPLFAKHVIVGIR